MPAETKNGSHVFPGVLCGGLSRPCPVSSQSTDLTNHNFAREARSAKVTIQGLAHVCAMRLKEYDPVSSRWIFRASLHAKNLVD